MFGELTYYTSTYAYTLILKSVYSTCIHKRFRRQDGSFSQIIKST